MAANGLLVPDFSIKMLSVSVGIYKACKQNTTATNITTQMRESLVALFEAYHAKVRIVYLETDWQELLKRNSSREAVVPQSVIENMLGKLALPEAYEARIVEYCCV